MQDLVIVEYHKSVNGMYVPSWAMLSQFWPCSVTHPVQYVNWVLNETNR